MTYISTDPHSSGKVLSGTTQSSLEDNWVFVKGITPDHKVVDFARDSAIKPGHAHSNRYSFLINRLQSIEVTIDDFSFSIADLMTNPAVRQKVIKIVQKKIEHVHIDIFNEALRVSKNIKSKPKSHHFKIATAPYDLSKKFKSIIYLDDLSAIAGKDPPVIGALKWIKKVTKFPEKIKKHYHSLKELDFSNPSKAYESSNAILKAIYDAAKFGSSVVKFDKDPLLKTAFHFMGLGDEFKFVSTEVLEICKIGALPLNIFHVYFEAVDLYKHVQEWQKISADKNSTAENIHDAKLKIVCSTIGLVKQIVSTTVCALTVLGIIPQVPIVITLIISGIGIIKITINIYKYFAKEHKDKTTLPTPKNIQVDDVQVEFQLNPELAKK